VSSCAPTPRIIDAGSPGRISSSKKIINDATSRVTSKANNRFARKVVILFVKPGAPGNYLKRL